MKSLFLNSVFYFEWEKNLINENNQLTRRFYDLSKSHDTRGKRNDTTIVGKVKFIAIKNKAEKSVL